MWILMETSAAALDSSLLNAKNTLIPSSIYRLILEFVPPHCEYCGEVRLSDRERKFHRIQSYRWCTKIDWKGSIRQSGLNWCNWWHSVENGKRKRPKRSSSP